jgi:hypothetical protein
LPAATGIPPERSSTGVRVLEDTATMSTILWILAVILVVAGVFAIVRGQLIWGIVLIIVGLLVGPGGVSIFA